MEAFNNLLTGDFSSPVSLAILFATLLVAIIILYFLFRMIFGSRTARLAKNRQPRLSITDAAVVDDKRRLVLLRRDDVEHLVMIGGPTDIVVEQNIVRTSAVPVGRYQQAAGEPVSAAPAPAKPAQTATPRQEPTSAPVAVGAATLAAGTGLAATASQTTSSLTGMAKDAGSSLADATSSTLGSVSDTISNTTSTLSDMGTDAVDAVKEQTSEVVASVTPTVETTPEAGAAPSINVPTVAEQAPTKTEDEMQRLLDELAVEKT